MEGSSDRKNILARLVRNSFFLITSRVLDFSVVIVTTPIIARYLGVKAFGDYALVTALTIFFGPLVEFGTESIICRDISKDKNNPSLYINSTFVTRALFSILLLVVYYGLTEALFPSSLLGQAVLVSAFTELILSLSMVFPPVFRAYEKMEYELLSNLFNKVFSTVAVLAVAFLDYGFLALFYVRALAACVLLMFSVFFVFKKLVVFKWGFSLRLAVSLMKQGLPVALVILFAVASSKIDVYFLKYFKGSAEIALFEIPNRLIGQFQFIPLSVVTALIPFFSRSSMGLAPSFRLHYATVIKFLYICSIFTVMLMVTGADVIIVTLFSDKFQPSVLAFRIISWIFIFFSMNFFIHQILIILGRQKAFFLFAGFSFIVNAGMDLLLIPHYGYIGASIATVSACLTLSILSILYVSRQIGRINIADVFAKPTICISLTWLVSYFLYKNSVISFITIGCIGLLIYISLLLLSKAFSKTEMKFIREFIIRWEAAAEITR